MISISIKYSRWHHFGDEIYHGNTIKLFYGHIAKAAYKNNPRTYSITNCESTSKWDNMDSRFRHPFRSICSKNMTHRLVQIRPI